MKSAILASLLLAISCSVFAAPPTDKQILYCVDLKEVAEVVTAKKNEGITKSQVYAAAAATEGSPRTKEMFFLVVDNMYAGGTPERFFNLCIETAEEVSTAREKKSATKSNYTRL